MRGQKQSNLKKKELSKPKQFTWVTTQPKPTASTQVLKLKPSEGLKYDPSKNLLLQRNMLVIKRQLWETPTDKMSRTQLPANANFLNKHFAANSTQNQPEVLSSETFLKLLHQGPQLKGENQQNTMSRSLHQMESLRTLQDHSIGNNLIDFQSACNTALMVSYSPLKSPHKQVVSRDCFSTGGYAPQAQVEEPPKPKAVQKQFMMLGTRMTQSSRCVNLAARKNSLRSNLKVKSAKGSLHNLFSTSTIQQDFSGHQHQAIQPYQSQALPQPEDKKVEFNTYITSVESLHQPQRQSDLCSYQKAYQNPAHSRKVNTFTLRAKSATVRLDNNQIKPSHTISNYHPSLVQKTDSSINEVQSVRTRPQLNKVRGGGGALGAQISLNEDIQSIQDVAVPRDVCFWKPQQVNMQQQNAQVHKTESGKVVYSGCILLTPNSRNFDLAIPAKKPQTEVVSPANTQTSHSLNLRSSANLVRQSHLKRAELIAASHSGQFKMDGQETGEFLIKTNYGCQISGDSLTALSVALPQTYQDATCHQPQRRPQSAYRRVKGSTITSVVANQQHQQQRRGDSQTPQTHRRHQTTQQPLFALMPTYTLQQPQTKSYKKPVYKLVLDRSNFQSARPHSPLKPSNDATSRRTVRMQESP